MIHGFLGIFRDFFWGLRVSLLLINAIFIDEHV